MEKIRLTISYDGTNYHGWQKQDNVPSIQEELEKACHQLFGHKVTTRAAGRTDTGVHALGQSVALKVNTPIPISKIPSTLNNILPEDIVVTAAQKVAKDFHPQYWAKSKTYEYRVINAQYVIPQMRNYAYFVYQPIDIEAMKEGAKYFVGTHDFAGFCSAKNTKTMTTRTIHCLKIRQEEATILFTICGDGFLYNMIRIIIGTLIQVGIGEREPSEIRGIILSKNRLKAGITAPACGLTMCRVEY